MEYKIRQFDLTQEQIENLSSGDLIFIPESDYGLGKIYKNESNEFELYSIPMYGGEPELEEVSSNAKEILETLQSWT